MTIRVVIGEDNLLAREGICRVLEAEEDIEIVASCGDLATLRDAVGEQQPDVVLADIQMPPTKTDEGIRLAAELRATHPGVGVVILSQYAEPLLPPSFWREARTAAPTCSRTVSRTVGTWAELCVKSPGGDRSSTRGSSICW